MIQQEQQPGRIIKSSAGGEKELKMMTQQEYQQEIDFIFNRFPSYQTAGKVAYKPGIGTMEALDKLLGHPHRRFRSIHVAGTNGKGSTSHMLAAALQKNHKVGLYTSPHLVDFRERVKVNGEMVSQEFVYNFLKEYKERFVELGASFFEITTALAFAYFAAREVDVAVIECGLGGRLDSTNIITPELAIITNIGLDHCEHLGFSLPEVAGEKAGIIKPGVPVVIGEKGCSEVESVFREKAAQAGAPILFAEEEVVKGGLSGRIYEELLGREMDLKGACQQKNIKGVSVALQVLQESQQLQGMCELQQKHELQGGCEVCGREDLEALIDNICRAAHITGLRGRWETLCREPLVVCDTGHNAHGFKVLGPQIERGAKERMKLYPGAEFHMVFGVVADKDLAAIVDYLPKEAHYHFVKARGTRALQADVLAEKMAGYGFKGEAVGESIGEFLKSFSAKAEDFVFIGGSTFVVAEAIEYFCVH